MNEQTPKHTVMEAILTRPSFAETVKPTAPKGRELPTRIIAGAAKYAQLVEGTDKMIPHEQVFRNIYQNMGWEYED